MSFSPCSPQNSTQLSKEEIKKRYPMHYMVWQKDHTALAAFLEDKNSHLNDFLYDNHGRTPLGLAVTLFHKECALTIAKHREELLTLPDKDGFTPWHEALTTQDPELVRELFKIKEKMRVKELLKSIASTMSDFGKVPDFYFEMSWKFSSWMPLIGGFCPNDTYKVYKHGFNVRVDSNLLELASGAVLPKAIRGNRSYIFLCGDDGGATFLDMDHNAKTYTMAKGSTELEKINVNDEFIHEKMKKSVHFTRINTENQKVTRAKSGLFSTTERTDEISGYICGVYNVSGIEMFTKTRTEHCNFKGNPEELNKQRNLHNLTDLDYFSASDPKEIEEKDVGLARSMHESKNEFKARVWLSDEFPCSTKEQLIPVLQLCSLVNPKFQKLIYFISINLPKGFPVQLEFPVVFAVLNAQITFGNVYASQNKVNGVKSKKVSDKHFECSVDEDLFKIPPGYKLVE